MSGSSGISWECHWGEAILLLHSLPRVFVFGLAVEAASLVKLGLSLHFATLQRASPKPIF